MYRRGARVSHDTLQDMSRCLPISQNVTRALDMTGTSESFCYHSVTEDCIKAKPKKLSTFPKKMLSVGWQFVFFKVLS
jgi:hypothetical protein